VNAGVQPQNREVSRIAKELRINEQIRVPQVRLIRDDQQVGIVSIEDAQRMADESDLDLVEIAPNADPPVAKVMDYGKYKYEQSKRERESRRGSKQVELREVRMRVKIGKHDFDFKSRTARKLLMGGDKVKVSVLFRAREITHPEVGRELLDSFFEGLEDIADIDRPPRMEGRFMSMILDPSKKLAKATAPAADPEPAAAEAT
jgi:translation initiation factor IF-3